MFVGECGRKSQERNPLPGLFLPSCASAGYQKI